jgi:hypothetical protein
LGGEVIRRIPVEPPKQQHEYDDEVGVDATYCEVSV